MTLKAHGSYAATVGLLALVSCTGAVAPDPQADDDPGGGGGDNGTAGRGSGSGNGSGSAGSGDDDFDGAGPVPLMRLTRAEYDRTVRDLLGDASAPGRSFASEATGPSGYETPGLVGSSEAARYMDAAEALATAAVKKLSTLAPCAQGKAEATCADDFVAAFGRRAFRRPLTADERTAFSTLYQNVRKAPLSYDHANAVRVVVTAFLQSPQFLYHWELGPAAPAVSGDLVRLTNHEVAARLSYLLWGTMPDDELFAAADAGRLTSPVEVEAQARRLLKHERSADAISSFFGQWLETHKFESLAKDKQVFPQWKDELKTAMLAEANAFIEHAILEDGRLETLLTAPYSFVDASVASVYGLSNVSGTELRKQQLPEARVGLFTQSAFLALHSKPYQTSPVQRGMVIMTRLLCEDVPPPPPDVDNTPPAVDASKQTREQYAMHSASPACRACHEQLDPYGFAFEHFDAMGKYRTMEAGRPVDASGEVTLDEKPQRFANAKELMTLLSNSAQVKTCMARQWLRYASGRAEVDEDRGSVSRIARAFSESGGDFRELLLTLVTSKSFLYRAPAAGEVMQ